MAAVIPLRAVPATRKAPQRHPACLARVLPSAAHELLEVNLLGVTTCGDPFSLSSFPLPRAVTPGRHIYRAESASFKGAPSGTVKIDRFEIEPRLWRPPFSRLSSALRAWRNPFREDALGARVPDVGRGAGKKTGASSVLLVSRASGPWIKGMEPRGRRSRR